MVSRMMLLISILLASGVEADKKCQSELAQVKAGCKSSCQNTIKLVHEERVMVKIWQGEERVITFFADKASLQAAVREYDKDADAATAKYGAIAGWDVTGVTDMSQLFYATDNFNAGDISGWDTSRVTDMWGMFSVCCSPRPAPPICSRSPLPCTLRARSPRSLAASRLPAPKPAPHRVPCLRPSAARDGLQPAPELGHVPRHGHDLHVSRALL